MVNNINDIEIKIEKLRKKIHRKIEDSEGLLDLELLKLSQELDGFLNERSKLVNRGE